jgi:hypothetical protein
MHKYTKMEREANKRTQHITKYKNILIKKKGVI